MSVAAAAMTFVSCVKENVVDQTFSEVTLNAVTETGQTKTALTGFADVVWAAGDKIAVYDGAAFTDFTLSSGAGTASAAFSGTLAEGKTATAAVYPASAKGAGMTTVKYPTEYAYSDMGVNAPMVASVVDGVLQFKHVGGVVKFDVGNIPPTAAGFVFTANSKITGDFTVTEGAVATSAGAAESVKITFTPASMKSAVFMVPLPTGTYTGFSVKLVDGSGNDIAGTAKAKDDYSFTIARKQLLTFPAFVDNTTPASTVLWEGEQVCTSYNGITGIPMPDFAEGDVLRIHFKDVAESSYCLMLSKLNWNDKFKVNGSDYLGISPSMSSIDVDITAALAEELNTEGGFIVQGHMLTITKIEYVGQSPAETVLWTGNMNAGGFAWLPEGALPVTLKPGDKLCFYYVADATAPYRVINVCNGWNTNEGEVPVFAYPGANDTYTEITFSEDDLAKYTSGEIRLAFNYITLKKIVLK